MKMKFPNIKKFYGNIQLMKQFLMKEIQVQMIQGILFHGLI